MFIRLIGIAIADSKTGHHEIKCNGIKLFKVLLEQEIHRSVLRE